MRCKRRHAAPRERLLQISEGYVNCAQAYPAQFRLMFVPLLSRKREFPTLRVAAEQSFGMVPAAVHAHVPEDGPALALLGRSLCHGLKHLLIDAAFDGWRCSCRQRTCLRGS